MTTHNLTYTRLLAVLASIENPYSKDTCRFCGNYVDHAHTCPWQAANARLDVDGPESKVVAKVEPVVIVKDYPPMSTAFMSVDGMRPLPADRVVELLATGDACVIDRGGDSYLLVWLDRTCPTCLSHLEGDGAHYCQGLEDVYEKRGADNDKS